MTEAYLPHNKAALVAVIKKERHTLDSLLEDLSASQKKVEGIEAFWSVKDIMAHVAAWESLALDRLNSALTGQPFEYPVIKSENFVDDFNDGIYQINKTIPLDQVEAEYTAAHQDLMTQINTLEEKFLQARLPFDWAGELTAMVFISANTHWHYPEHAASIRNWLADA